MTTALLLGLYQDLPERAAGESASAWQRRYEAGLDKFQQKVLARYSEGTLERLLDATHSQTRQAAALALGLCGTLSSNRPLAGMLHDEEPAVRQAASEALWSVWSDIGTLVSERRENALPFLAQDLSDAVRHARATGASTQERNELTALLERLRRWRNDLPHLFAAVVNFGLLAADGCTAGIDDLARGTREIVDAYDREHLGEQFDDFAEFVGRYRVDAPATLASS